MFEWLLDQTIWAKDLRAYLHASHIRIRMQLLVHGEEMGISLFLAGIAHPCSEGKNLLDVLLEMNYAAHMASPGKVCRFVVFRIFCAFSHRWWSLVGCVR